MSDLAEFRSPIWPSSDVRFGRVQKSDLPPPDWDQASCFFIAHIEAVGTYPLVIC